MGISRGKVVQLEYTLRDPQGTVLDASEAGHPLPYLQGAGNIIKGLEKALEGHEVGDEFDLVVPPEEAYGSRDDSLLATMPRGMLPPGEHVQPGMPIQVRGPQWLVRWIVLKVSDTEVVLDRNHPLAGITLHFHVKVHDIRDATAEELKHGHPHGPGGHQH